MENRNLYEKIIIQIKVWMIVAWNMDAKQGRCDLS